jgi:hypothetical protein
MSIASDLIASAQSYSAETLSNAIAEMNAAMNILGGLTPSGHLGGPTLDITVPDPADPGTVPEYVGTHYTPDKFTGTPPILGVVPPFVLPQDPAAQAPDLSYDDPNQPAGEPDASLIQNPPNLAAFPTAPTLPDLETEIQGIAKPVLVAISIPDAPTYQAPEFTGTKPVFNAVMPTDLDDTLRTNFTTISPIMRDAVEQQLDDFLDREFPNFRAGMAAIETRLATYLAGGSALTPEIEDAIFNRTLDKTNADAKRAMQEALGKAARAGFTMFTPTLLSQAQDIDQDRRNNNARAATEIAIEQAKLEQNNLQFAVSKSADLRKMAVDASISFYSGLIQINGQALEYARSIVDSIVKAFDIAARYAETQARLYEAEGQIFKVKLDGALAIIQVYEQQIKGELAKAQVNHELVEEYKARLGAVQVEADVFKAAVEAVVAEAGLERIKVELYQARVNAYAAQVNAYSARWQGYGHAVQGQASKMQVNVEHARAFEARAAAYGEQIKGRAAAVESAVAINKQLLDTYRNSVEAFATLQHAKVEGVSIDSTIYRNAIDAYRASAEAISQKSQAVIAKANVLLRELIAAAELYMEHQREVYRMTSTRVTETAKVAVTAGEIYSGIAQAALSGMNSLAAEVVTASS